MTATPAEVVRKWFERVWNQSDESAIEELLAPAGVAHGLENTDGTEVRGAAGFKRFARDFRNGVPDIKIAVIQTISEGEMCAAHCEVTGTHRASGVAVRFSGIAICRVREGQIQEAWNCFDFLTFYERTGAVKRVS